MMVRRAVITAAGRETRQYPASTAVQTEMIASLIRILAYQGRARQQGGRAL